ncbi:MAG TPA: hypothetical protein VGD37_21205 [Kofleriaceae bacterium]
MGDIASGRTCPLSNTVNGGAAGDDADPARGTTGAPAGAPAGSPDDRDGPEASGDDAQDIDIATASVSMAISTIDDAPRESRILITHPFLEVWAV